MTLPANFLNIFEGEDFQTVSLTNAINLQPVPPFEYESGGTLGFTWASDTSTTPTVAIDMQQGQLYFLPTVPRDAPLPVASRDNRWTAPVTFPRLGESIKVRTMEVLATRGLGDINPLLVNDLLTQKLNQVKTRARYTQNYLKRLALDGIVADPITLTPTFNMFAALNAGFPGAPLAQLQQTWNSTATGVNPLDLFRGVIPLIEDQSIKFGGFPNPIVKYEALCGRQAYRWLMQNQIVVAAFQTFDNVMANQRFGPAFREVPNGGFRVSDQIYIVEASRSRIPGSGSPTIGFIDDWTIYVVPVADGFMQELFGPSEFLEFVGNPQEYYVNPEMLPHGAGVELWLETFPINYVTRPDMIVKITVTH